MTPHVRGIPRGVWVLGFVSMFMDISSELIHSLLPVFMVSSLGASAVAVGLVEGVAEATALIAKVFSGTLSDYLGRRKGLTVLGYGLGAVSKPLFAMATAVPSVLAARFMDRIGKGMRGAPRDALVADLTPEPIRGAAYGLRQSLDTVGAFLGPLLAMTLMVICSGNFRAVFWFAVIPAALAVLLLIFGVHEPAPAVLVLMNVVYALTAYPAGKLSDGMDRRSLLAAGLVALLAADVALAKADGLTLVAVGVALWGLHMGLTQGLFATMVAAAAPANLRGTAFGFFNLASGVAMLVASVLAGLLWDRVGPSMTFVAGGVFSSLALLLLVFRKTPAP